MNLAILTAAYNDWECVCALLPQVDAQLEAVGATGTVVIVDDGSARPWDQAGAPLRELRFKAIERVEVLTLHRNLGNQRAVAVGVSFVATNLAPDYLVIMDSDFEDNPAYIPDLLAACRDGDSAGMVFAARTERSEGVHFQAGYRVYKWLYKLVTGTAISFGNFSIIPGPLIKRVAHISELWSHFPAAVMRARIPYSCIPSIRGKRLFGVSKMSLTPLVLHALSGFAVHADFVAARGMLAAFAAMIACVALAVPIVLLRLFTDIPLLGWTSQVLGLLAIATFQLFTAGTILVFMIIALRLQTPSIPFYEHAKFIGRVDSLTDLRG